MRASEHLVQSMNQCLLDENHTLFDVLSSKEGLEQFTHIIRNLQEKTQDECIKTVPTPINRQVRSSQSKSQFNQILPQTSILETPDYIQIDFYQFMNIMDELFVDVVETQIMDWFQLIQTNEKILIRDLYVVMLLIVSKESKQQFEFLYQYGYFFFECLKQQNCRILGLTILFLMKLYGISAKVSRNLCYELNIKNNEEYTFEDFEMFCFCILNPESSQGQGYQQRFCKQYSSNKSDGAIINKLRNNYKQ